MSLEGKLGVIIEGKDQLSQAIGQAQQAVQRYDAEVAKLKKLNDQTVDGQLRLGAAMMNQKLAHDRLREAMQQANGTATSLKDKYQAMAGTISAIPGPAGQAASQISSMASSMGEAATAAGPMVLGVVGIAAAAAAAGVALLTLAKKASDYQEALDLLSERSGLATRDLGALKVAAAANGTEFTLVERSVDFFTNKIKEASTEGSDAEKMFQNLGVSVRDASGKIRSTGDILRDVQSRLNGIQDPAIKTGTAMEFFGARSARAVRTLTAALDENGRLAQSRGVVFSPETEDRLRKADAAFDNLALSMDGFRNSVAALAASNLEPFISAFSTMVQKIQDFSNDPKVQTAASLMQLFTRQGGQGNPTVNVGRDKTAIEKGEPGLNGPIFNTRNPYGPQLDAATKARIDAETGFSDAVKQLAKERAAAEADAMKTLGEKIELMFSPRFDTTISGVRLVGVDKPQPKDPMKEAQEDWKAIQEEAAKTIELNKKEADGLAKVNEETQKRIKTLDEERKKASVAYQTDQAANAALRAGIHTFFTDVITGTATIKEAFFHLIESVVQQVLIAAATNTVLHALGIPLQTGGTFTPHLQAGGSPVFFPPPVYAQSGLVTRSPRGLDRVHAMIGGGETVLSHGLTDQLARVLGKIESGSGERSSPRRADAARNLTVTVVVQGSTPNRGETRRWAQEELAPILGDIIPRLEFRTV